MACGSIGTTIAAAHGIAHSNTSVAVSPQFFPFIKHQRHTYPPAFPSIVSTYKIDLVCMNLSDNTLIKSRLVAYNLFSIFTLLLLVSYHLTFSLIPSLAIFLLARISRATVVYPLVLDNSFYHGPCGGNFGHILT